MSNHPIPESIVNGACRFYRLLLRAYPASFRREFESEMVQVFRDTCRDVSGSGLVSLWARTLGDLVRTAVVERWSAADRRAAGWLAVGIAAGLMAAYVDFHNDEVQAAVLVELVFTFLLGAVRPKGAWRWALAVGLGVPVAHLISFYLGYPPSYPVQPNVYASFLALIPAFLGAYFGAMCRWGISPPDGPFNGAIG